MTVDVIDEIAIKNNPTQPALSSRRLKKGTGDGLAPDKASTVSGDKFMVLDSADNDLIKLVDHDNMPVVELRPMRI